MNHFDNVAKTWDENPIHWERSQSIAQKISAKLKLQTHFSALEYGAGTGILSFVLKDNFKSITLMDSSVEMVKVIEEKIKSAKIFSFTPLHFDLESSEYTDKKFDVIYTQMALHHVVDVSLVIKKFYSILANDGQIAIADLYTEDGSFHGEGFIGHNGFDPEYISSLLTKTGFKNIQYEECFKMGRPQADNSIRKYPIFLITGTK